MSEPPKTNFPPPDWAINPGNFIALSRNVREHPIVGAGKPVKPDDPARGSYSRMEAWIDLLCLAQYKPARVNNRGEVVTLDVGQLLGARSYLALRWNWSDKTVRNFLETLEVDEMISFSSKSGEVIHKDEGQQKGQQSANSKTNKANVITVCNYSRYQLMSDAIERFVAHKKGQQQGQLGASKGPAKGPAPGPAKGQQQQDENRYNSDVYADEAEKKGQQRASTGASTVSQKGPDTNTKQLREDSNPLPPLQGGEDLFEPFDKAKRIRKLDPMKREDVKQAHEIYNKAAAHFGFTACNVLTVARATRLAKRLDEIGGAEKFRLALRAISKNDFLSGRVAPKPGQAAFRLDFDRLLQTDGQLGDVLAKLLDQAGTGEAPATHESGKSWGWWRADIDKLRGMSAGFWRERIMKVKPNGQWPWWILGAPPGDPECVVHPDVVAEFGFVEIYKGQVTHD
jgi:DNA-binding transcriptional regulator YhcF (GntR family)